jgi:membrane-bound lytic murein transglycosylase F
MPTKASWPGALHQPAQGSAPEETEEPDRTWLALAAYNIGPGHFNAARTLARQLQADPNAWYEMKRVLPLLAQPKYAQQLKIGKARGGEAVILVENIRSYYDILQRNTSPWRQRPPRRKA